MKVPRRRTLFIKFIFIIPAVWLCVVIFFSATGNDNKVDADNIEVALKKHPKDLAPPVINQIQGFGPPMKMKEDKEVEVEVKHKQEEKMNEGLEGGVDCKDAELPVDNSTFTSKNWRQ
ncbi:unnamed protein product [Toxocara canis]|uniref:Transmembrane protein n=1 Tax=Toxocara canis TaxID=6265 RepID=A0A183UXY1_TOXCA|nr:unnamed protein product [Toxocara canis]